MELNTYIKWRRWSVRYTAAWLLATALFYSVFRITVRETDYRIGSVLICGLERFSGSLDPLNKGLAIELSLYTIQ